MKVAFIRHGGRQGIYRIRSGEQPTRSRPPAGGRGCIE